VTDYLPHSLHREGRVRFTPWIDGVEKYYEAVDFQIGLAPLKAGLFNRSKSPIKALEYAAMGIPIIASDAGPYPTFVENGQNGLLIRQDYQWLNAINRLLVSDEERVHMGEIARRDARRYTIEEHAREWLYAYESGIRHALQQ
jgi:glycosyltransferase involved in cell wall biosynthesis